MLQETLFTDFQTQSREYCFDEYTCLGLLVHTVDISGQKSSLLVNAESSEIEKSFLYLHAMARHVFRIGRKEEEDVSGVYSTDDIQNGRKDERFDFRYYPQLMKHIEANQLIKGVFSGYGEERYFELRAASIPLMAREDVVKARKQIGLMNRLMRQEWFGLNKKRLNQYFDENIRLTQPFVS